MRSLVWYAAFGVVVTAACGNPFGLIKPNFDNTIDTVTVYAVNGTGLDKPSAFLLATKQTYRLGVDQLPYNFDFVYRVASTGAPELAPFYSVVTDTTTSNATGRAGYLLTTENFDDITVAQQSGYVTDTALALVVGQTFYFRSGLPNGCYLSIPYYAKVQVISIDPEGRSVTLKMLVDNNCGYRGLVEGLPTE